MNSRIVICIIGLSAFLWGVAAPTVAQAQCAPHWTPGDPFSGVGNTARASIVFDFDGPGGDPERLIVGGDFLVAGGVRAHGLAVWDGMTWHPAPADLNGVASSLTLFNGQLVVGGSFPLTFGKSSSNVAKWNGAAWEPLAVGVDGNVSALFSHNGRLFVGGDFQNAGGQPALRVAAWDGANWAPLSFGMSARVRCFETYAGDLIAGGDFGAADGVVVNAIARWDGESWHALSTPGIDPSGGGSVHSLTIFNKELIVGGTFVTAGGVAVNNIAGWNGSEWRGLGSGMTSPGINSVGVYSLRVVGATLVAGGEFSSAGGVPAKCVAVWNGTTWQPLASDATNTTITSVNTLAMFSDDLYVGGRMESVNSIRVANIARWDSDSWGALGSGAYHSVNAFANYQGQLVAGGRFVDAAGLPNYAVARWTGYAWRSIGTILGGTATALVEHEGQLVAAGSLRLGPGGSATSVAVWDGASWQPLSTGLILGSPTALASIDGQLIVGGSNFIWFVGGRTSFEQVGYWDGTRWLPVDGAPEVRIVALTEHGGDLYVTAGSSGFWKWDGISWQTISLSGTPISCFTEFGTELIAGGSINGTEYDTVVAWDGSNWVNRFETEAWAQVDALASHDGQLIAGGRHLYFQDGTSQTIARWDGSAWSTLGKEYTGFIGDLGVLGRELFVAGPFEMAGGEASANWARWGCPPCEGDANGDGSITFADLSNLLSHFGMASGASRPDGDLDGDEDVDLADLAVLLTHFGESC